MSFLESSLQLPLSFLIVIIGSVLWIKNARLALILLAALVQTRYLLWRGLFTLETTTILGLTATVTLYLAECYGLIQNLFFFHQTALPSKRSPAEPTVNPRVDIFVTIVNEPLGILKRTLIGCLAQDYPQDRIAIHVLDDGGREEVKRLAHELGCNYLRRGDRVHAKAGNLNHALKRTNGELIAIFDVDHVPVRSFLRSTVGFFEDEKVAFVQTPQHFYNPDLFQKNLRLEKEIENDQDLFFRVIQAGRDAHNSAFFAGSSGVLRRKALDEIGGFRTDTLTEDVHTSLLLHSKGWKSCYLNNTLSAGLSPESLKSYLRQRERWAIGAIQTLFKDNPLFKRSLSFSQRLHYFASIYYFFNGIPRIVYMTAPLTFLLFGISAIIANPLDLIHYFFSCYLLSLFVISVVGKGYRRIIWSDVYETMMCFSLSKAIIKAFLPRTRSTFYITPKGETPQPKRAWKEAFPFIVLFAALLVGIGRGLVFDFENKGALLINMAWASFNSFILFLVIQSALERPQRRRLLRLRRSIKCVIKGSEKKAMGYTTDISENGVSVRLEEEYYFSEPRVDIELKSSYGEVTRVKGVILRQERDPEGTGIGIRFENIDEEISRSLIRQMFSPAESWAEGRKRGGFIRDVTLLFLGIIRPWRRDKDLKRLYPRFPVQKPCLLVIGGESEERLLASTIDISYSGLSIFLKKPGDNMDTFENARVELDEIVLRVAMVGVERLGVDAKLHLKVKAIENGEETWRKLSLPS